MPNQYPPLTPEMHLEALKLIEQYSDSETAARATGMAGSTLRRRVRLARAWQREQAMAGRQTPGFVVSQVITQRDALGQPVGEFVREQPNRGEPADEIPGFAIEKRTVHRVGGEVVETWDREKPEALAQFKAFEAAVAAVLQGVPRMVPADAPAAVVDSLCNVYTITDYHMGMLAWHREGGADWDIGIATRTLDAAFAQMVAGAPAAGTCIIAQLGDFMHYDGMIAQTPTSGHALDADGRFSKMVGATLTALRRLVDHALVKHGRVILLMAEGNHDIASSVWLRHLFGALYENEPRVEMIDSELPYYAYQFGNVMLGWHHGHLSKNETLPGVFSAQFRSMWGACERVYIHTGHRHHREVKEHAGCIVEQHATLAARDAYAARGGWHAERAATAITYHRDYGEVGRNTVRPEMLAAA